MDINDQRKSKFRKETPFCHITEPISLEEALNLISTCKFDVYTQEKQIVEIHFKINEELDKQDIDLTLEPHLITKLSAIITFQSTIDNESRIFWKTVDQEVFYQLEICDYFDGFVTKHFHDFLVENLQNGQTGILKNNKDRKDFYPQDIGNEDGHNLLSIAVIQNNDETVEKLLGCGFDVNSEIEEHINKKCSLIDLAWRFFTNPKDDNVKISSNNIILYLLNTDSKFPQNFSNENASTEVQQLVNYRKELHDLIHDKNYEALKEILTSENNNLYYYYDTASQSLLMHALRMDKDSNTLETLSCLNLKVGAHESVESGTIFRQIRNKNRLNAKDLSEAHISKLVAKSKIADYNDQNTEYPKHILEAYQTIDKNESCSNVLKVVAEWKKLEIFFDFKHDTTYYFDPSSSIRTKGITYSSGQIHIGAKNLLNGDENEKQQVLGVMIHEFCHLAILITYMNNFDPYQMGESENKNIFVEKVVPECKKNRGIEGMVDNVFDSYISDHFHSELIVLICHMLIHYYVKDPEIDCENSKIIENREQNFPELFQYFKEIIEPELIKASPVLKKLQDDEQKIKFCELTEPMKAKILSKKIDFQGEKVPLFEIIENDEEILSLLNSDEIKDILLDGEAFSIGDVCEKTTKYDYVDRSFSKYTKNNPNQEYNNFENTIKSDQIISEVEEFKTFILAAKAGEGKTATFENLTKKLKNKNKNFWVSFVKLRNFRDIFDKANLKETTLFSDIFMIFVNILFPNSKSENFDKNSDFKIKVFKKLFDTGKVILLLDGYDEIFPKFNHQMISILRILKRESSNQLFVSSRSQHVEQLMGALSAKAFTLKSYGDKERDRLIFNICVALKMNYKFFHPRLFWFFKSYKDFNNPFLIIIVTELYINDKIDLAHIESFDYFGIYTLLVDEQFDEMHEKVDKNDRSRSLNFSILHQVLALKFIFDEEQINDLQIMKNWKKEKKNWSAEKIQRFGFVVVDLKFLENDNKGSIDFIHYSIAEFFVAQYILENIFNENVNDKDIEHIFEIIKLFKVKNKAFLLNYLKNHWDISEENIQSKLTEIIVDEIEKCSKINVKYGDLDCLHFWCPFLKNSPDLLKKVWHVNQKKTLLNKLLFSYEIFGLMDHRNIFDFITDCLGDNWHEILNNSGENLNIDDEIEENSENIYFDLEFRMEKIFFKNFYKLLVLVEKTFDPKEKKLFDITINLFLNKNFKKLYGNYFEKCFEKILNNHKIDDVLFINIILSIISGAVDVNKLNCMQEILENFFKNDREKIREILFDENVTQGIMLRLRNSSLVEFPLKFKIFFNIYNKYKNSWEEIQLVLFSGVLPCFSSGSIFELLKQMPTDFIPEFLEYTKLTFGSNNEHFFEYIKNGRHFFTTEQILIFEDFLIKYFDGDEINIQKVMRAVLYSNDKIYLYHPTDNLVKYINIRRKYQNSIEEFQEYLKSWEVLSKIFLLMTNESYPIFKQLVEEIFRSNRKDLIECIQDINWNSSIISSEDKFFLLEQFFNEFFNDCEEDTRKCIRKIILSYHNISIILTNELNDKNEFERVKNIYRKYLTIEEIRSDFVSNNALFCSFKNYSLNCHPKFVDFAKEIFKQNNKQIFSGKLSSSNPFSVFQLLQSDTQFKYFEKFLTDFYENDEYQVKSIIRKVLFNQSVIEKQLFMHSARKSFNFSKFQYLREIYTKYKNSWEEIQNIFTFLQNLLEIFSNVDEATFPVLQEFLIEIFESNKFLLFSCFNYNKRDLLIKRPEKLKFLEKFLQKFTDNDEDLVKYCFQNILFADNFNPLELFVKIENLDKLEYLITIYKKYKISWEKLQMFFTSKPLSNLFFRYMSDKTYPIIEEFIREIFDSNKHRLNEIELIYDIKDEEDEDYFYDEDNEKYFIEKFKLFCNSVSKTTKKKNGNSR